MLGKIAGTDISVNMRLTPDGKLSISTEKKNEEHALADNYASGIERPLIFTIEDDPPTRDMSRFLCKMALEAMAELFCKENKLDQYIIDEKYFDNIRNFARYGANFNHWPYSQRRIFPYGTLMRHPDTNEWVEAGFGCGTFMNKRSETLFAFCFYGVEFVINVGGPSIRGYEEWLQAHNGISPMIERLGCSLISEGEGRDRKHYLHDSFSPDHGLEFDRKHGYGPHRCKVDA